MSDTPRTDAAAFTATFGRSYVGEWNNVVLATFAVQLERELAQAKLDLEILLEILADAPATKAAGEALAEACRDAIERFDAQQLNDDDDREALAGYATTLAQWEALK